MRKLSTSDDGFFLRRVSHAREGLIESVCQFCGHVSASRDMQVLSIVERVHDCPGLRAAAEPPRAKPNSRLRR